MAGLLACPKVELKVSISLSEQEARALDALVGYGDDQFVKQFYEFLGKAYMQDHEAGLRSLFKSVRSFMPGILESANDARKAFQKSCGSAATN